MWDLQRKRCLPAAVVLRYGNSQCTWFRHCVTSALRLMYSTLYSTVSLGEATEVMDQFASARPSRSCRMSVETVGEHAFVVVQKTAEYYSSLTDSSRGAAELCYSKRTNITSSTTKNRYHHYNCQSRRTSSQKENPVGDNVCGSCSPGHCQWVRGMIQIFTRE